MVKRHFRRREGFTLIELLIVLAIIGALMAIGIPIYSNALESAKATTIASNIRTIADGVRMALTLEGSASNNPASYIQLDDATTNYLINISGPTGTPPTWTVKVYYKGSDVDKTKIEKKLNGCKDKDIDSTGVYCEMEVTKTF